jgi:hypothetical protein
MQNNNIFRFQLPALSKIVCGISYSATKLPPTCFKPGSGNMPATKAVFKKLFACFPDIIFILKLSVVFE